MRITVALVFFASLSIGTTALAQPGNSGILDNFQKICIAQAPGFATNAIQSAAERALHQGDDYTASASVEWKPGKHCTISARMGSQLATPVGFEAADRIVMQFMKRMGGGSITMRKVKRGGTVFQYRMTTPAGKFDITFRTSRSIHRFSVAKM